MTYKLQAHGRAVIGDRHLRPILASIKRFTNINILSAFPQYNCTEQPYKYHNCIVTMYTNSPKSLQRIRSFSQKQDYPR